MDMGAALRTTGQRMTPQRRLVWDALRTASGHLTAEELHARVRREAPDLNLASVYRTLRVLEELGLAREVRLGDGRGHWEIAHADDAYHLVCRTCGRVEHHEGAEVEEIRTHLGGHGFSAERIDLVVHGQCATCARLPLSGGRLSP